LPNVPSRGLESALAIQRGVVALTGQAIGGWKCRCRRRPDGSMRRRSSRRRFSGRRLAQTATEASQNRAGSRVRDGRRSAKRERPYSEAKCTRRSRADWCSSSWHALRRPPKWTGSKCWRIACRTRTSSSVPCCRRPDAPLELSRSRSAVGRTFVDA
jgi:hypothetical protein